MMATLSLPMRRLALVAGVALACATGSAAQTTTIGAALTTSVGPFTRASAGFQTAGQSFTVPAITTQLSTFSLSLSNFFNGAALRFDAYIMAFDSAARRVTGDVLWSGLNLTGSTNDFGFDTRTFSTGNLNLMAGSTYLFLITTSNQSGLPDDASNLLGASDVNAYSGGAFWVANNGGSMAALREAASRARTRQHPADRRGAAGTRRTCGAAAVRGYASLICCRCAPRPATRRSTTSPARRKTGGFMAIPTPGGVPVAIRSPASSVMNCDT
jgi:hypothetical protein